MSCAALMPALATAAASAKATSKLRTVRFGARTLHVGMRGSDVSTLQHDLTSLSLVTPASGVFTPATRKRVKEFQSQNGLSADGVVGPQTFAVMKQAMVKVENTTNAPDTTNAPTATASSAALPADDSGGAGFVPANTATGGPVEDATLNSDGTVTAPADAPVVVQKFIAAANRIAFDPYVYGGGHNGWGPQSGYDCSGSTSYALHAAGLLSGMPLDSSQFMSYGDAGPGQWLTIYTDPGHVYVNVAGLWFDTADQSPSNGNDRWSLTRVSPADGFVIRHPAGW